MGGGEMVGLIADGKGQPAFRADEGPIAVKGAADQGDTFSAREERTAAPGRRMGIVGKVRA